MRRPALALFARALGVALVLAGVAAAADLTPESYDRLRGQVLPKADDQKWLEIPWRPTFWEAVVEAQETDRPVLLWAMNGHPLACT
jgi:hypothetical protein